MTAFWDVFDAELADTQQAERAKRQPALTCRYCGAFLPRRTRTTVCCDCSDLPAADPHTMPVVTRATTSAATSRASTPIARRTASPASSSPGTRGTGGRNTQEGHISSGARAAVLQAPGAVACAPEPTLPHDQPGRLPRGPCTGSSGHRVPTSAVREHGEARTAQERAVLPQEPGTAGAAVVTGGRPEPFEYPTEGAKR